MRIRHGFISNSSSTSFVITNTSDLAKDLVDFVSENPHLIEDFKKQYSWHDSGFCQENMIKSASAENIKFLPHETKECIFGDEDGTLIGQVFDYILREGGRSQSFTWRFKEFLR